jgi:hypothetical protein
MPSEVTSDPTRGAFGGAIRYWEPRRFVYNLVLTAVATGWVVTTWPHFRDALTWPSFGKLLVLAGLANACYCAAYLVDIPMQLSGVSAMWRRWRFGLWLAGMLFAVLIANYWIADEIYPFAQ